MALCDIVRLTTVQTSIATVRTTINRPITIVFIVAVIRCTYRRQTYRCMPISIAKTPPLFKRASNGFVPLKNARPNIVCFTARRRHIFIAVEAIVHLRSKIKQIWVSYMFLNTFYEFYY